MDIALIGIAFRMPGAKNFDDLYESLKSGACSAGAITDTRKRKTNLPANGTYKAGGFLEDIDAFDYPFFNIPLAEAETMDPHQRLLLEVVYETIENAAYDVDRFKNQNVSVFASLADLKYYELAEEFHPTLITGNTGEFLVARISSFFGLTGNSVMVNTSCSSSLVAVHMACNELRLGEAEYAIVCGANLELFPYKRENSDVKIEAADGLCKSFSDKADGMGFGEVVACLLLKPLEHATRDNDHVYAVIAGSAVNNNGNRASSLTAPDSITQAEVFQKAWRHAGVAPEQIGFIEAHGSGTKLGDSIEIGALNLAFGKSPAGEPSRKCAISTIKSNIGHGRAASGLAGIIKAVLSLKSRKLFPAANFEHPNSLIDFYRSAIYVNTELKDWEVPAGQSRYAGVTSIGLSGVNCHVVLREFTPQQEAGETNPAKAHGYCLVNVSSKTAAGLLKNLEEVARTLKKTQYQDLALADVAYTLAAGRKHYTHRYAWVGNRKDELLADMEAYLRGGGTAGPASASSGKSVLILSGSALIPGALVAYLSASYDEFRTAFGACKTYLGEATTGKAANFAFQYAFYHLLISRGVTFDYVLGAGLCNLVSAVIAGEMELEQACRQALFYEEARSADFAGKVRALVESQTADGPVLFTETGLDGTFAAELNKPEYAEYDFSVAGLRAGHGTDPFMQLIRLLYLAHCPIDWAAFHDKKPGSRLALFSYQFDKKRCWIRDEEKTGMREVLIRNRDKAAVEANGNAGQNKSDGESSWKGCIKNYWEQTLELRGIADEDDFFEIGGDSLDASRVINKINADLKVALSFEDLFDFSTLASFAGFVKSQLRAENLVAYYWKEALKVPQISSRDNFFELGGHSLLANKVINRVNREFGLALSFDDLFRYPVLQAFADYIERLAGAKANAVGYSPIGNVEEQSSYGIAHQQWGLWIIMHFEGQGIEYNTPIAFSMRGNVDTAAMQGAFMALVERHEILRTRIVDAEGQPRQQVYPGQAAAARYKFIDVSATGNAPQAAQRIIAEDAYTPFDLERETLFRVKLIRLAGDQFVILLNIHHIISDNWSMEILIKEFLGLYNDFRLGRQPALPPVRVQYKDFVYWQQAKFKEATFALHQHYWQEKLADLTLIQLPVDFSRPPVKTNKGDICTLRIDHRTREKLEAVGNRCQATLFTTVLSSLKALLYRYTGQEDLVLGTAVSGRWHADLEDQLGFYANTLPLRTQFTGNVSFEGLVQQVNQTVMEAFEHQIYPFDKMIEDLGLGKDLSRSPVFDIGFSWRTQPDTRFISSTDWGVQFEEYETSFRISKYDLSFHVTLLESGLVIEFEYSTALFKRSSIERLVGRYQHLLTLLVSDATQPLWSYGLVSREEETRWEQLNATTTAYPRGETIQEVFERQVSRQPDAVALVVADHHYTYAQLNARANQLAGFLMDRYAVQPEQLVGLMVERNEWLLIGMLGILKTGGAYLPLAGDYPKARLSHMFSDSGLELLLTESAYMFNVIDYYPGAMVVLDVESPDFERYERDNPPLVSKPDSLAYVMYTSGSTGFPKGVMIEHRGVVRLVKNTDYFSIGAGDKMLHLLNYVFDGSLLDLYGTQLNGATLCIADKQASRSGEISWENIVREKINVLCVTTALFNNLVDSNAAGIGRLDKVYFGGERCSADHVRRASLYRKTEASIVNVYGPTEGTSISTTFAAVLVEDDAASLPIGKPIANSTCFVLGPHDELKGVELPGELHLGGDGLARGYLNAPELTREKFVTPPGCGGQRLYKTGDTAKLLESGNLEFIGRKDSQVKLRGYRIELGEIENAIRALPAISDAVAIMQKDKAGDDYLIAYYRSGGSVASQQLRRHLETVFPPYLVPAYLVDLHEFPLTRNGKIAYNQLPLPKETGLGAPQYVSPRNRLETKLAEIWQEVLGKERVGITDNFFELGGHSLKATQVVSRLYKELGIKLDLGQLFIHTSIQELSEQLTAEDTQSFQAIFPVEEQDHYGLSHAQKRLWLINQVTGFSASYNVQLSYCFEGPLDVEALVQSLKELLVRHESLRTAYVEVDGEPRQRVDNTLAAAFVPATFDWRGDEKAGARASAMASAEMATPFDLAAGPLLRVKLLRLADRKYVFLLTMHHILCDEWSRAVMIRELLESYQNRHGGADAAIRPLLLQYKDYAAWQNGRFAGSLMDRHLAYWQKQLSGNLPVLEFPTDFTRPRTKTYAGAAQGAVIEKDLVEKIKRVNQATGTTLFIALVAGVKIMLYRYTGQNDIIVGMPVSGREHIDLEDQIGFYANTVALRTRLAETDNYDDILRKVGNVMLDAFNHQEYPFDDLIRHMNIPRDTSRMPLFDVMVQLMTEDEDSHLASAQLLRDLEISMYHVPHTISKYDLLFSFKETEGKVTVFIEYSTDLFAQSTIERLLTNYIQLIRNLVETVMV